MIENNECSDGGRKEVEVRAKIDRELTAIINELEKHLPFPVKLSARPLLPLFKLELIFPNHTHEVMELERRNIRLYYSILYNHKLPHSVTKQLLQQKKNLEYKLPE